MLRQTWKVEADLSRQPYLYLCHSSPLVFQLRTLVSPMGSRVDVLAWWQCVRKQETRHPEARRFRPDEPPEVRNIRAREAKAVMRGRSSQVKAGGLEE
jgi:hypothetical protein